MRTDPFRVLIARDLNAAGVTATKARPFEDLLAVRLNSVVDLGTVHIRLGKILDLMLAKDKDYRADVTHLLDDLTRDYLHNLPSVSAVLVRALRHYELAVYVVHDLFGVISECWGSLHCES
jgi:hypothetical protein